MAEKFLVFEDAVRELKKTPNELKALVDEGKLRSFMDSGKMKFRQKDVDDLKAAMGIASEEDELTLAPADGMAEVPPVPEEEKIPAPPAAAQAAPAEEEFTIEPLDEEAPAHIPAPKAAKAEKEAPPAAGGEEEVASLSDFEISEEVEEKGREIGEEEAELLAVQAPAFRTFEEEPSSNTLMTVVLVTSLAIIAFAAVAIMSYAWNVDIKSLTSLWPA